MQRVKSAMQSQMEDLKYMATNAQGETSVSLLPSVLGMCLPQPIMLKIAGMHWVDFNEIASHLAKSDTKLPTDTNSIILDAATGFISTHKNAEARQKRMLPVMWRQCFQIWTETMIAMFSDCDDKIGSKIRGYRNVIESLERDFAISHPHGYMDYDEMFRHGLHDLAEINALVGEKLVPGWKKVEDRLFNQIFAGKSPSFCRSCLGTDHATRECTKSLRASAAALILRSQATKATSDSACFAFNKMHGHSGCARSDCTHAHVCYGCKSDKHTLDECPKKASVKASSTH
ncbi:MAG: hypothetical protein COB29_01070 [Sulfitobacter sp.]|nr:MAG: hypothetical protein COB29_01070 [Sulfitobacter sp.]